MNEQSIENSSVQAFRISLLGFLLLLAVFLSVFTSPLIIVGLLGSAALALMIFRKPSEALGICLAIMPVHFLAVLLGKFYGVPHMTLISALSKEVPFLLVFAILWRSNGIVSVTSTDCFLLAFLGIGIVRTLFSGSFVSLVDDFDFIIPYAVGRVAMIGPLKERRWARYGVWIAAILSVVGVFEVLVLGDGPRKLLYAAAAGEDNLADSFYATGFEGLRAGSTTAGPLVFGALCMVALVVWWVYLRNPVPAILISAGMISALTRSAWIGSALAITVLGLRFGQRRRLAMYALLAIIAFIAAIPILGIRDYISSTRAGNEASEEVHSSSLSNGFEYAISHPFGSGPGSIGPRMVQRNSEGLNIESSYLTLAAEYGIAAALCFGGFLATAFRRIWNLRTDEANAAIGILIGFAVMMAVLPIHMDFRLACWVWFPIGLAIRHSLESSTGHIGAG